MSRHLFYSAVLLLIVMMCCGTGVAHAEVQPSQKNFEWKVIKDEGVTVESLGVPSLLKVGSEVFAVAEAKNTGKDVQGSFTGIASQLLTETVEKKDNTPVEIMNDANTKTQFLEESISAGPKKKVDVSRPTTVMKGKDIYMIAGKYSQTAATGENRGADDSGLLLVKGEVGGEENKKIIYWKNTESLPRRLFGTELESLTGLIGGGGSGVKMHDDTLVFPVEGTKKKGDAPNDVKTVSLIIHDLKDTTEIWKLSKGMSDGGCSDPSVVEWKDKKLIMMTACDGGRRRVYEIGDKGESWTEALGTLSRVWSNKQGAGAKAVRSGFITAKIDGEDDKRNVMLVTLPVYSEKADKKVTDNRKSELHLWLTDNTHIVDIGPVFDDDAAASSLLYKSGDNNEKEELIALYEKKKDGEKETSPGMVSVLLTAQLKRVKDVLATWKEVDGRVSKLCTSESVEKDASTGDACSPTVKITDGLVGFLSGNFSGNTWRDEYLGVNATVKNKEDAGETGATNTSDGVTFRGAWAEWPVGSQGENQLYHFANYNFTLVATVSIHGVPQEGSPIPLMGVQMNDSGKIVLLGLSYNSGKKWQVLCSGGPIKEHSSTLEKDTTHQVVLMLRNGTQGSAYVDGHRVGGDVSCALGNKDSKEISHFYIGGDGEKAANKEGVSVTVTNVLLYNRPLDGNEINALNPNKASTPILEEQQTAVLDTRLTPASGSVAQQTVSLPTPAGPLRTEQESSMMSSGVGGVGVSNSGETTVTNPLPGLDSVQQLASVKSSDGTQSVNAASSSVGDKRVGRGAGDETQNDETHQPSMGTPATADANAPTAKGVGHDGPAVDQEMNASIREDEEAAGGINGQEDNHAQHGEVKAAALSSSLGNVSQGNNTDAGTVRGSGLLPLLLLLLGLWVFAAL